MPFYEAPVCLYEHDAAGMERRASRTRGLKVRLGCPVVEWKRCDVIAFESILAKEDSGLMLADVAVFP